MIPNFNKEYKEMIEEYKTDNPEKEIVDFIKQFSHKYRYEEVLDSFMWGCCYWFAMILYIRFQYQYPSRIEYNPIVGHFACRIKGSLYDICGKRSEEDSRDFVPFSSYHSHDAKRLIRDSILFKDKKEEEAE